MRARASLLIRVWRQIRRSQGKILAPLLFVLLTLIAAHPVATRLGHVIIGSDVDARINLWADWWTLKALTSADYDLWYTDYMFYPEGVSLVYHSYSHLNTAVSLLLRPMLGALTAYNVTVLLNLVLAALAAYQLARYLGGSRSASILAGVIYAFNSHNLYQSAHLVLFSVWCFPWFALYFLRAIRTNQVRYALAASVFVFLAAAASSLLLIIMLVWLVLLSVLVFVLPEYRRPSRRITIAFGGASALLLLPLTLPLLRSFIIGGNTTFVTDPLNSVGVDLLSFLLPHWLAPAKSLYFGLLPIGLVLISVRQWRQTRLWILLLLATYMIAIGPQPTLLGNPMDVVLPWNIPVAHVLRHAHRLSILVSLALAMLAAQGWDTVARTIPSRHGIASWTSGAAIAVVYFEFALAAGFPHTEIDVSPFYTEYLQGIPDTVALAQIPFGRQVDKTHLYYQTFHGHKITGGVVSRHSLAAYAFLSSSPLLRAGQASQDPSSPSPFPADLSAELSRLAKAGIGFLVIDKDLMVNEQRARWLAAMPVKPVFEDEQVAAYRTQPEIDRDLTVLATFSDISLIHAQVGRYSGESGVKTTPPTLQINLGWYSPTRLVSSFSYEISVVEGTREVCQLVRVFPVKEIQALSDVILITEDQITCDVDGKEIQIWLRILDERADDISESGIRIGRLDLR
jgi:hypothetical protein